MNDVIGMRHLGVVVDQLLEFDDDGWIGRCELLTLYVSAVVVRWRHCHGSLNI